MYLDIPTVCVIPILSCPLVTCYYSLFHVLSSYRTGCNCGCGCGSVSEPPAHIIALFKKKLPRLVLPCLPRLAFCPACPRQNFPIRHCAPNEFQSSIFKSQSSEVKIGARLCVSLDNRQMLTCSCSQVRRSLIQDYRSPPPVCQHSLTRLTYNGLLL